LLGEAESEDDEKAEALLDCATAPWVARATATAATMKGRMRISTAENDQEILKVARDWIPKRCRLHLFKYISKHAAIRSRKGSMLFKLCKSEAS
jgi:negative regulator of replication initiation